MRTKFTGARISREVSNTAQVALSAFGGAAAAFHYSASTVAALSLGSAGIPELQRIFNAKGRAEVYKDAAQMIHRGILEYYTHNPNPPNNQFTPNGLILAQRVSAAIDMVDDVLAGRMPSQMEMIDSVEPMTPAGTRPHAPGTTPVNAMSANPAAAAFNARVGRAVAQPVRTPNMVSKEEFDKLKNERDRLAASKGADIDFTGEVLAVNQNSKLSEMQKKAIYENTIAGAGLVDTIQPDANKLIDFFQDNANADQKMALSNALVNAKKKIKP